MYLEIDCHSVLQQDWLPPVAYKNACFTSSSVSFIVRKNLLICQMVLIFIFFSILYFTLIYSSLIASQVKRFILSGLLVIGKGFYV